ncbi:MAG: GtrA family protein [Candidatus Moraniibacteriota bacterium]|nr:MAG: GtrA family protein [Candidatus Moranbacteria bacterium]
MMNEPLTPPAASQSTAPTEPAGLLTRLVKQFSKFIIVGGINTGIDFSVLNVLIFFTFFTFGLQLFVLNCISFSVAVVNSYFMNKRWTFKEAAAGLASKDSSVQFSQFFVVSLIGITINGLILTGITTYITAPFGLSEQLWANFAKLVATGASLVWNFVGYKLFVFKK